MKKKKYWIFFIIIFVIILIAGLVVIKDLKEKQTSIGEEYTPQEEINDEQERQTIVSLYFWNANTTKITAEARLVDVKQLINDPYVTLINLLLQGPKNTDLSKVIPEGTQLLDAKREGDCVTLNFNTNLLNYDSQVVENNSNIINTIVNTLTELTEVDKVKIMVEGENSEKFPDTYVREATS